MWQDQCINQSSSAFKSFHPLGAAETGYECVARGDLWAAQEKRLVLQQYASLRHEMVCHLNGLVVGGNACEGVASDSGEDGLLRAGAHLFSKIPHQLRASRDLSRYVFDTPDHCLTPVITTTRGDDATAVITGRSMGSASSATTVSFELEAPSE